MTHKDIYTKFMIEYDKANVTSSYPSLTKYEIATILDKAYLALIAQKLTGNNVRQVGFEGDLKVTEDLRPLITKKSKFLVKSPGYISNRYLTIIPEDSLYFISANFHLIYDDDRPIDNQIKRSWPTDLVSHETAEKFFATPYNMPWIKKPVCYLEDKFIYFLIDSMWHEMYDIENMTYTDIVYIKKPRKFALLESDNSGSVTPTPPSPDGGGSDDKPNPDEGGDDPTPTPGPTPTPDTPETWQLSPISGPAYVYNNNNEYVFYSVSYSDKGNSGNVVFTIISGGEYAEITPNGKLTVKPTAEDYETVVIKAAYSEDESVYVTKTVLVKYYKEDAQPVEEDEVWTIQDITGSTTVYSSINSAVYSSTATSNKGNTCNVKFSLLTQTSGATITEAGLLEVFPAVEDWSLVVIMATCELDESVFKTLTVDIKYYINSSKDNTDANQPFILNVSHLNTDKLA